MPSFTVKTNSKDVELPSHLRQLAEMMGVRVPITPATTRNEFKLFGQLLLSHGGAREEPNFGAMLSEMEGPC